MLPVLPFLGGLASCGLFFLVKILVQKCQDISTLGQIQYLRAKLMGAVSVLALFPAAVDLFVYHPYQLSYYNRLIGGLRGAYQRGFEATYQMEALTPKVLQLLNQELPSNAVITARNANYMFDYYQKENRLRPDFQITAGMDYDYYIFQNRVSMYTEFDKKLVLNVPPYKTVSIYGVPLVYIYKKDHNGPS